MKHWIFLLFVLGCDSSKVNSPNPIDDPTALDETESPPDTQAAGSDDSNEPQGDCPPDIPDCTCVIEPTHPEDACWHGHGGRFADQACSASQQCCDGEWNPMETCGECVCTQTTGTEGCVPDDVGEVVCFPEFTAEISPIPTQLREQMNDVSYHAGCPVGLDDLSQIEMTHWGFDGEIHTGQLIVASTLAELVRDAFEHAYNWRFAIERMEPVSQFDGDDNQSMAANNTSAFNCRSVTGGSSWSQHSYGNAIDINPIQNPYVRGTTVLPPEGESYLERDPEVPGLIIEPGPVTGPFLRKGWGWGGQWTSLKDYQHFSENGL